MASQIREAGVHPASKNQRTIAVGVNKNGKQFVGSSNGFDRGQRAKADELGIQRVPSRKGNHAEENLMAEVQDLVAIGTSKRYPCGPQEHDCYGQLIKKGIQIDNIK